MSEILQPCPFCGSSKIKSHDYGNVELLYRCEDCGGEHFHSNWNTRPIEDALQARIAELEKQSEYWHSLYQVKSDLLDGCERGFTPELEQLQKRIAELEKQVAELLPYRDGYDPNLKLPDEGENVIILYSSGMGLYQLRDGKWFDALSANRDGIRGIYRWWYLPEVQE